MCSFGCINLRTSGPSDIRTFGHPDLRTCEQSPIVIRSYNQRLCKEFDKSICISSGAYHLCDMAYSSIEYLTAGAETKQ